MAFGPQEYLERFQEKFRKIVERGEKLITQLPELIKKSVEDKYDHEALVEGMVNNRIHKRRYGTTQASEMADISHGSIYAAEKDGRLPPPVMRNDTKKSTRAGYTINDINHIREVFGTAPRKPPKNRAAIVGILNLKGGCQKTTHCHLFSQYLALRGYRVLILDTDPQGSLSLYFGKRPDFDVRYENTMAPYLLEDDEALVDAGLPEGSCDSLHYAIQKTYWSNIDIIPACLENLNIDILMPQLMNENNATAIERVSRLGDGLREIGDDYDFIVVDGTPSLNISTLNVVSACDMVFVPTPAMFSDYASTLKFTNLIYETTISFQESECYPNMPDVRYFVAKYSANSATKFWAKIIRRVFNVEPGDVLKHESHHSDEIGKSTSNISSIYEVIPSEADNRKRLKKTVEQFDALFNEMHDEIVATCFTESSRQEFTKKIQKVNENAEALDSEISRVIGEVS